MTRKGHKRLKWLPILIVGLIWLIVRKYDHPEIDIIDTMFTWQFLVLIVFGGMWLAMIGSYRDWTR